MTKTVKVMTEAGVVVGAGFGGGIQLTESDGGGGEDALKMRKTFMIG